MREIYKSEKHLSKRQNFVTLKPELILPTMITISEDKWDDIKANLLDDLEDDEVTTEPLIRFDYKTNQEEEIGVRETHEFSKNGMDFMLILDKENKLSKTESEKNDRLVEHYSRSHNEYSYKLTIKFRDVDGSWKDSSAMEKRYEGDEE